MYHIHHTTLSKIAVHLKNGKLNDAKKELSRLIDNNGNVSKKIGQLEPKLDRYHIWLENARDTKTIDEMEDYISSAFGELKEIIKLLKLILDKELEQR